MIKLIVFDLGGVIIEPGFLAPILEKLSVSVGKTPFDLHEFIRAKWNEWKIGKINEEQFFGAFLDKAKISLDLLEEAKKVFYDFYSANLPVIKLIRRLKKNYKIALLSNISKAWFELEKKRFNLNELFDFIVTSFEEKIAKPHKRIYEALINKSGFKSQEIVFIDDRKKNLEAAKQFGMKTILFKSFEELVKELKEFGIKVD